MFVSNQEPRLKNKKKTTTPILIYITENKTNVINSSRINTETRDGERMHLENVLSPRSLCILPRLPKTAKERREKHS